MAIIWADSFDHYGTTPSGGRTAMLKGAWAQFTAGTGTLPFVSTTQKRTGDNSLAFTHQAGATDNCTARRVVGTSKTVIGCGFGLYPGALHNLNKAWGIQFRNNANTNIIHVSVETDGSVAIYVAAASSPLIVSDPVIGVGSWNHVETKCVIDNVVGEIEVRVNGLTVIHLTNQNFGVNGCTQIAFGNFGGGNNNTWYFDDIVVWDDTTSYNNNFLGAQRVHTVFPTADTAQADWAVVGAASGYEAIDDPAPDDDSTYISSGNAGEISEFALGDLPPETDIIAGVYIPTLAKLEDAGIGNIQVSLVSGSSASLGPDQVLTTAYTYWGGVHQTDPDTSLPWTKSGFEASILRVEKTY
jgi:hypothetical protein